jgi:hypothetical protein
VSKESARLWCFRWNDPLDKLLDAFSLVRVELCAPWIARSG